MKTVDLEIKESAYKAWMSAGSMGLSLWLANDKEATTGHRRYTVAEYGLWVDMVREMELRLTGKNAEFCEGQA